MVEQGHGDRSIVTQPRMVEALAPMCVIKVASYNEHTVAICKTEDPIPTAVLSAEFLSDLYVPMSPCSISTSS